MLIKLTMVLKQIRYVVYVKYEFFWLGNMKGNPVMTREENVFLAKKIFVELVYNTAYIEGCNVTFPQTQTIIDGAVVNGVSVDDIQTVLNLRDGWKYMMNSLDEPLSLEYICKVNEFVSRNESLKWGVLRDGIVGVGEFVPAIPEREEVLKRIEKN